MPRPPPQMAWAPVGVGTGFLVEVGFVGVGFLVVVGFQGSGVLVGGDGGAKVSVRRVEIAVGRSQT